MTRKHKKDEQEASSRKLAQDEQSAYLTGPVGRGSMPAKVCGKVFHNFLVKHWQGQFPFSLLSADSQRVSTYVFIYIYIYV